MQKTIGLYGFSDNHESKKRAVNCSRLGSGGVLPLNFRMTKLVVGAGRRHYQKAFPLVVQKVYMS